MLTSALIAGCAVGGGDDTAAPDVRDRDLALRAEVGDSTNPGSAGTPAEPGSAGGANPNQPDTGPGAAPGQPGADAGVDVGAGERALGEATDPAGDAGVAAPPSADVVRVLLVDEGASLRATIDMAGVIPERLGDGEAAGVGLDLYAAESDRESGYQVFLEGSVDGWFAYLDTPQGLARFVGSFALADETFVITVPWSALGARKVGWFSVFSDSSSAVALAAISAEDRAPDRSKAPYR